MVSGRDGVPPICGPHGRVNAQIRQILSDLGCAQVFGVTYGRASPSTLRPSAWRPPLVSGSRESTMSVGEMSSAGSATGVGTCRLVAGVLGVCGAQFGLDAELEWGRLHGRGLRGAAEELQRAIAALQHQQRRVLGLIDDRKAYAAEGSRDVADWAAGKLGLSRQAANDQVAIGRKLDALPALAEQAAAGKLSAEQAKPAVELAESATDAAWADSAPTMGVSTLQRRGGTQAPARRCRSCGGPQRAELRVVAGRSGAPVPGFGAPRRRGHAVEGHRAGHARM